nr:30S ribosomal protein S6 [Mycobacterium sp. UM_NZ2]
MISLELLLILDPTLDDQKVVASLEGFLDIVRSDGGHVDRVDVWGRRRLAYEVATHDEGIYVILELKARESTASRLDRELHHDEAVLRAALQETDG